MARVILSESEVEQEIKRLQQSEYVKLANKEVDLKYRRRRYLYNLRLREKRGRELASMGATIDRLEEMIAEIDAQEGALSYAEQEE